VANAGFGKYLGTIRNTGDLYKIMMQGRNIAAGNTGTLLPPHGAYFTIGESPACSR
jgi:hypothetical protein